MPVSEERGNEQQVDAPALGRAAQSRAVQIPGEI